jgi:hypothetical protein
METPNPGPFVGAGTGSAIARAGSSEGVRGLCGQSKRSLFQPLPGEPSSAGIGRKAPIPVREAAASVGNPVSNDT